MGRAADAIEDWLGEPAADFAVTSAGVGLSGTILEWIKAQGWASGVGDEILQAVVGLGLRKWGDKLHEQVPNFGKGMLYHLAGRIISENVSPLITKTMRKGYSSNALNHAFHQKYGRNPSQQEMALMQQRAQQNPPIAQQQVQQPTAPPIMDYHFV